MSLLAFAAGEPINQATLDQWMKELSNWGRWGKDDQLGTVKRKRQSNPVSVVMQPTALG